MTDKGHQGYANPAEERQRPKATEGGHASQEKGAAHEFDKQQQPADASRRGGEPDAGPDTAGQSSAHSAEASNEQHEAQEGALPQGRRTRGGTHVQHVTAGKKGGSRIRELIELGYKYEEEHGIGPGRNERSKLAAKRRTTKGGGEADAAGG
jgi:hypothetical protein